MAEEKTPHAKKAGTFDKDLIRELADLLGETGLSEIEIEHEGKRVRVARALSGGAAVTMVSRHCGHPGPSRLPRCVTPRR
jgi:acetyl-CoA carboxylase biotin carboxyl carrier protein